MKQRISDSKTSSFILILLALLLLLISHSTTSTSAPRHRLPPHHRGDVELKANKKISSLAGSSTETKEGNDLYNLMGFEEVCEEVDEECLKRRMIAEAHLDYIYTQHHHNDKKTTISP